MALADRPINNSADSGLDPSPITCFYLFPALQSTPGIRAAIREIDKCWRWTQRRNQSTNQVLSLSEFSRIVSDNEYGIFVVHSRKLTVFPEFTSQVQRISLGIFFTLERWRLIISKEHACAGSS